MSFNKRVLSPGAGPFVNNENFRVVTYTGNGGSQSITGVGFQPDFVWHKARSSAHDHNLTDSTRGVKKGLNINDPRVEGNQDPYGVTSFDADGFTVNDNSGGGASVNGNGITYVAWCWKGGGGATSNSDGSITSTVNANKAAGFSIVKYTGTGSSGTVGHGLSSDPKLIINKRISQSADWLAGAVTWTKYLEPNGTPPFRTANVWTDTQPTSTTFGVINSTSASSVEYINYCFADVAGYQKIATYTGTGGAGNFINTGFEPAFVLIKNLDNTAGWLIFDNARSTTNPRNDRLEQNNNQAEQTNSTSKFVNFFSNGFEPQVSDSEVNGQNEEYLYWAIAANPDEETPTLASSFNIETYTGTGGNRSITNLGFKPGFIWLKRRDASAYAPRIFDIVRGATNRLQSSTTATESSDSTSITSFDADGFSLGSDAYVNYSGGDFVAWTFKADDNEPTINTNGTITSTTNVNANAGFSIVKYVGTGSNGSVGHGLSSTPELILIKNLDDTTSWNGWTPASGVTNYISLNLDSEMKTTSGTSGFSNGAPTSTLVNLDGSSWSNQSGSEHIMYCFHSVSGYSKVGSYTGSTSGITVTVGFKPDFILIKSTSNVEHWAILDTKRGNFKVIKPNTNDAESDSTLNTFTVSSTGFSFPHQDTADAMLNENGYQYIYMAVAKNIPSNTTLTNSFKTVTYTGTGNDGLAVTGVGFQPDLVWIKNRDNVRDHNLADAVQGPLKEITPNTNEAVENRSIQSFDSDGFTLDNASGNYNASSDNYVAWCWKAGNTWQSNVDGTIQSVINVNTTNGFSIVKWNSTSSSSDTIGHGLSSKPTIVLYKKLSATGSWFLYTDLIDGSWDELVLNSSDAASDFAGTYATSTTFKSVTSSSGAEWITYCFHSVSGYSSFGTYTGNGSTQSITGLGFQPDWLMIKQTNASNAWRIFDSARGLTSPQTIFANLNAAEDSESNTVSSFDSDGFTMGSQQGVNDNGDTYLYMAFKAN